MDISCAYHIIQATTAPDLKPVNVALTDMDLLRGALLKLKNKDILLFEIDAPEDWEPPHFIGHRFPVVSNLLADILSCTGANNFEAFPARIRNAKTNVLWDGYSLFNVLGLIDAADLESSVGETQFETESGRDWMDFDELNLRKDRTLGMDVFRLVNGPNVILMHGRILKVLIEKAPPNGWGFTATEVGMR